MNVLPLPTRRAVDESGPESSADDDGLAFRAAADANAFGDFYVQHRDAVFAYLRARLGDEDLALELTAVTFERALKAIGRYRATGAGPRAWLLRIARNASTDEVRRRLHLVSESHLPVDRPSPGPGPEELAIARADRAHLRRLVAGLSEPERDALGLRFGGGLPAREIGPLIGKNEDATKKLIQRAIARLKEAYRDDD